MKHFALALALVAATCGVKPLAARASCSALPYVFVPSVSYITAATTNANNNDLYACATNVDNTQIGTAGIFGSQIICTTVATCTFSNSVAMKSVLGILVSDGNVTSYAPPGTYQPGSGGVATATASTSHLTHGTCNFPGGSATCSVPFNANNSYTSGTSYACAVMAPNGGHPAQAFQHASTPAAEFDITTTDGGLPSNGTTYAYMCWGE